MPLSIGMDRTLRLTADECKDLQTVKRSTLTPPPRSLEPESDSRKPSLLTPTAWTTRALLFWPFERRLMNVLLGSVELLAVAEPASSAAAGDVKQVADQGCASNRCVEAGDAEGGRAAARAEVLLGDGRAARK